MSVNVYQPAPRDHVVNDLETLVTFLRPFVEGYYEDDDGVQRHNETVIWYDRTLVTAVLDDLTRRDFCSCPLAGKMADHEVAARLMMLLREAGIEDQVLCYWGRFRAEPSPGSRSDAAA